MSTTLTIPLKNIYKSARVYELNELLSLTRKNEVFYLKEYSIEEKMEKIMTNSFTQFDKNVIKICMSYHPICIKDLFNILVSEQKEKQPLSLPYRRIYSIFNNEVCDNEYYKSDIKANVDDYKLYDLNNFAHIFILLVMSSDGYYNKQLIYVLSLLLRWITKDNIIAILSTLITLYSYILQVKYINMKLPYNFLIRYFSYDINIYDYRNKIDRQIIQAINSTNTIDICITLTQ